MHLKMTLTGRGLPVRKSRAVYLTPSEALLFLAGNLQHDASEMIREQVASLAAEHRHGDSLDISLSSEIKVIHPRSQRTPQDEIAVSTIRLRLLGEALGLHPSFASGEAA